MALTTLHDFHDRRVVSTDLQQLLPDTEVKLNLSVEHGCDGDFGHFGELVLAVWNRIADLDRRRISEHWNKVTPPFPMFALQHVSFENPDALATTMRLGYVVAFDWPTCQLMPDAALQSLVAHELAHVFQFSIGKSRLTLTTDDIDWKRGLFKSLIGEEGIAELHADQVMTTWGFDPLDVDAWLAQFTTIHGGTVALRQKPLGRKYARALARRKQHRTYHSSLRLGRRSDVAEG